MNYKQTWEIEYGVGTTTNLHLRPGLGDKIQKCIWTGGDEKQRYVWMGAKYKSIYGWGSVEMQRYLGWEGVKYKSIYGCRGEIQRYIWIGVVEI